MSTTTIGAEKKKKTRREVKICKECGAKLMEHPHSLSAGLVSGLKKLAAVKNPINLKKLDLTRSEWYNFQKLKYWKLIVKAKREDGSNITGEWQVTDIGKKFVAGRIKVPRKVYTFRGKATRWVGPSISIGGAEMIKRYKKKEDYAAGAIPHESDS